MNIQKLIQKKLQKEAANRRKEIYANNVIDKNRVITLSDKELNVCEMIAKARYTKQRSIGTGHTDLCSQKLSDEKKPWMMRELTGVLGEYVAYKYFKQLNILNEKKSKTQLLELKDSKDHTVDDGDLTITISGRDYVVDAKTTNNFNFGMNIPHWKSEQEATKDVIDIYTQVKKITKTEFYVVGHCTPEYAFMNRNWNANLPTPCYTVNSEDLITDINELLNSIAA